MTPATRNRLQGILATIEEKEGRLTADGVLRHASDPASILHDCFEWDDAKAGKSYRLAQARAIIRTVRIEIQTEVYPVSCVAYVRDPQSQNGKQGYLNTVKLRSETDLARDAVLAEFRRVASALTRAKEIAVVLGLTDELDALLDQLATVHERVDVATPIHRPS